MWGRAGAIEHGAIVATFTIAAISIMIVFTTDIIISSMFTIAVFKRPKKVCNSGTISKLQVTYNHKVTASWEV